MIHLLLAAALAAGFRNDGTGLWPDATAQLDLEPNLVWRVPTPAWGNASPVPFAGLVCYETEPTTLSCVDARTGAPRWSATSDYADTLSGEALAAWRARLAEVPGIEAELEAARAELSHLRREIRRAGSGVTGDALTAASRRLDAAKAKLTELEPYLTPPDKEVIGYTSPTPVAHGDTLYALFGNGVLSAFAPDGARRWATWLGPPAGAMAGYDFGTTASPLLVDGTLITAHGRLRAHDPATGALRWIDGQPWRHFGEPGVIRVGGEVFLLTADGRALRLRDGVEVAKGLGDIWYTGPLGVGTDAYWVGGFGRADDPNNAWAVAWRFTSDGQGGLVKEQRWRTRFPVPARVYMRPALVDGRLYVVTEGDDLVSFDAATGAAAAQRLDLRGTSMQGVQGVGGKLLIADDRGGLQLLAPGADAASLGSAWLGEEARASPVFSGDLMFVRTVRELRAYRTR